MRTKNITLEKIRKKGYNDTINKSIHVALFIIKGVYHECGNGRMLFNKGLEIMLSDTVTVDYPFI